MQDNTKRSEELLYIAITTKTATINYAWHNVRRIRIC